LLLAAVRLQQYEPEDKQWKVGEAYALVGYAELLMAEGYCAGVPLDRTLPGGGVEYGTPLTTDSLLATAETHFDSALAHAHEDATVQSLARIGLARARLDRGNASEAAAAVADVPTSFVYNAESPSSTVGGQQVNWLYKQFPSTYPPSACGHYNVADREGGNGIDFASARDPRLLLDSTLAMTCDGKNHGVGSETWYYPVKFGNPSTLIPLATGVEARLIEAEAALEDGHVADWAGALDALRAGAANSYLHLASAMPSLTADSTTLASPAMQVDVMFRERAFWLFGLGTRLGDMRRLIRQYGRTADSVFPVGTYPNGTNSVYLTSPVPSYGNAVAMPLPTEASGYTSTNPQYRGCLTSVASA
jgi:hypothetical protein